MAFEVPLLGFDELESQSLKLCADIDAFGQGGLDILCPLSPEVHDELFTPFSGALSGDSTDESLLSSPSLGASLAHDASSCLDALHSHQSQPMPLTASQRQESVVSAYHPAPAQQQYQLTNTSSCSEGDQSTCPSSSQLTDDAGSTRSQKRAKLEWTAELHARFVEAVESLPCDKQVPSRILERMGAAGRGLTRANIASHLQKYRSNSGRRKNCDSDLPTMPGATATAYACPGGVVVGVPCFPLMQAPAGGFAAAAAPAPASPAVLPMLWPTTPRSEPLLSAPSAPATPSAPAMIPTPHGAAAAAAGAALSLDADMLALDLGLPQLPVPAELTRELEEVLAGKRKRAPLGLRLDCAALAQELNFARFHAAGM